MVNRSSIFAALLALGCSKEPKFPAPPALPGTVAMIEDRSMPALEKRAGELDAVLAVRWDLGAKLEPTASDPLPPLATIRALYKGPVYGLVRCDSACAGAMKGMLADGAARAHLEQRILRRTEEERYDGVALDLSGFDDIDAAASAFVEEMSAAIHAGDRKIAVMMKMTCRDVLCHGARLLGRLARAADLVVVEELDEDVATDAIRIDRRRRIFEETLAIGGATRGSKGDSPPRGPTARVFLGADADVVQRREDAHVLGLGGVYVGTIEVTGSGSSREAP